MTYWPLLAAFVGAYVLGSVPFGLLLTKSAGLGDIRAVGSGNIGATNVLRTGHKGLAALTLILDAAKGAAAVLLAHWLGGHVGFQIAAGLIAGFGAVIGHVFPVWLKFTGGKGVATMFGVIVALSWPVGLVAFVTWLLIAVVFRLSSLAAIVAVGFTPVFALALTHDRALVLLSAVLAILVIVKHHANIRRLLTGTEPKIGK
jgi:glycerol-3-phosphate acyltransferase PlsY